MPVPVLLPDDGPTLVRRDVESHCVAVVDLHPVGAQLDLIIVRVAQNDRATGQSDSLP